MAADKAYPYIDWPRIEDVIYAEEPHPKSVLAPLPVKEGTLYQCFFPGARRVQLVEAKSGRKHAMKCEDEAGWFAVVLSGRKAVPHSFLVDGREAGDPYALPSLLNGTLVSRFQAGIGDRSYKLLGAHLTDVEGQTGTEFVLWAPGAARASVVGEWNHWDGRANPMEFNEETGLHELFIPGIEAGTEYKYELRIPSGLVYTRPDPYGFAFSGNLQNSVVTDPGYRWHDKAYLKERRERTHPDEQAIAILEYTHTDLQEMGGWRDMAPVIAAHAAARGYTHVELPPVMEYADPASGGYHTVGYFAPTNRYGTPADLKYLVDTLHGQGIGVIFAWTPAQFSPDTDYLASFDGTCLYEHLDPRQGVHPLWGTKLFNYGRAEVRSFLMAGAVYWLREYHADGLRADGCATMLRNDYARGDCWVANYFGSGENLEGIDFLKKLNTLLKREYPDVLLLLEESVDFPDLTAPVCDEGFGFDLEWNLHFPQDVKRYLSLPAAERTREHQLLENASLHNLFKKSVLSVSRGVGDFDGEAVLSAVSGSEEEKRAAVRALYVYLFTHPGKKLLTRAEEALPGEALLDSLVGLYRAEGALYEGDFAEDSFEWMRTPDEDNPVVVYTRAGQKDGEFLLIVLNFSGEDFAKLEIGVPRAGKYKELLNTDDTRFGGGGAVNLRARTTRHVETDEREDTLRLRLAPQSAAIFRYQGV